MSPMLLHCCHVVWWAHISLPDDEYIEAADAMLLILLRTLICYFTLDAHCRQLIIASMPCDESAPAAAAMITFYFCHCCPE